MFSYKGTCRNGCNEGSQHGFYFSEVVLMMGLKTLCFYNVIWKIIPVTPSILDEWMTCNFTSFSTVFQSCQDDGRLIMKGCVEWNSVYS